jgi:hypothetical protein
MVTWEGKYDAFTVANVKLFAYVIVNLHRRGKRKVCVPVRVGDMSYICVFFKKKSSRIIVRINNAGREEMKRIT